ncbi:6-hydroxymethylpterin diphosphokinase MptE-like protein [Niallia sp. JL1B1071]|uniref:6-hydroxymethylpterin diphosphokinase MptE-like protein n=1 Tax=Niallia tiangongensis TaxID=3237105 RepID=UPI0037DD13BB
MTGDKLAVLMNMFPYLHSSLSALKNETDENKIEILKSKIENAPTLSVTMENRSYYLHSKYDPNKEAEVLIDRYRDELDKYDHVLFYGVGLGYHVETLVKRYPNMNYSLFEPAPNVFKHFLESNRLDTLDLSRLKNVYIDTEQDDAKDFLINITGNMQERIMLIALPSYERIFEQKYKKFTEDFKAAVTAKYESNYIDNKFSARWTLNSLLNLPVTLTSPNILSGFESVFKDKPLIIVSAGPSLEEEYENLRAIKEQKTAFIFAVGSANKALIANGIIPDAVCTYDPQDINYSVFTKMLENDVINVPMIYGTSVGFETLKHYPGPKLHMITSQDTVTPYYMGDSAQYLKQINDAPTIAAVTLQLACELECNPVLLVGQNLALKGEQRYSSEIENEKEKNEENHENFVMVKDVHGNLIKSTKGFINMKTYLEQYISSYRNIEVINTTNGGAAIDGTIYQSLSAIMQERLMKEVVPEDWHKKQLVTEDKMDKNLYRLGKMEDSIVQYLKLQERVIKNFSEIEELAEKKQVRKLDKAINQLNSNMQKLTNNDFYNVYILPINRTQYQALIIRATEIRKTGDIYQKAKLVINAFLPYVMQCKQIINQIIGSIYNVHLLLETSAKQQDYKFYASDCGVFHFQGDWKKENYAPSTTIDYPVKQMVSKGNSLIEFKFTGTTFKVFGSKGKLGSKNIEITIDGNIKKFSSSISNNDNLYVKKINEMLFQESNLENKEHHVAIKVIEGNHFYFTGVEIERTGRLFHINEVTDINTIKIGERIRCHYAAKYNKVGLFEGLGEETGLFLPPEASAYPDGDFYFIMVDEIDGKKKLIADRNVQHSISWSELVNSLSDNNLLTTSFNGSVRLVTGGTYEKDINSEWVKYIGNCDKSSEHNWNIIDGLVTVCSKSLSSHDSEYITRGRFKRNNKWVGENGNAFDLANIEKYQNFNYPTNGFRPLINR